MSEEVLKRLNDHTLAFFCPACEQAHIFEVPRWKWNESMTEPTFEPSLKMTWGPTGATHICHLHVRQGTAYFCTDCTHPLRGQSVRLKPWDWSDQK